MTQQEQRKPSLGRGLSALLGETTPAYTLKESISDHVQYLPLEMIKPGKYQPRQHFDDTHLQMLVDSIQEKGIIQPLIVRPLNQGLYELVAGERRWRAAKVLELETVPVLIRPYDDREALETALIDNIQRNDLTSVEEAEAYERLMTEFNYTQEILASRMGKSRSHIANMLRLNTLPPSVKQLVQQGKISAGHARVLVNSPHAEELAKFIITGQLSVRDAERLIKVGQKNAQNKLIQKQMSEIEQQAMALSQQFSKILEMDVKIKLQTSGGSLTISFRNYEEMDEILEKLRSIKHYAEQEKPLIYA